MYSQSDIDYLEKQILKIKSSVNELNAHFLPRKFTLDGHLLGSVGEIYASYYYGIDLYPSGKPIHDGFVNNKDIQIKVTQNKSVELKEIPNYLIVLHIDVTETEVVISEVFNGPGSIAVGNNIKNNNGEYYLGFKTLLEARTRVKDSERIIQQVKFKEY